MATSFRADPAGIAQLGRSEQMQAAMGHLAEKVKAVAEAIAPVDTGRYKASFEASSGVNDGLAYGRVSNATPYAGFLEFGTRYMRKQRVLGRALDALRG